MLVPRLCIKARTRVRAPNGVSLLRAQGGKERLLKHLPVVEARMADGRKFIAGDEFTAAGKL